MKFAYHSVILSNAKDDTVIGKFHFDTPTNQSVFLVELFFVQDLEKSWRGS